MIFLLEFVFVPLPLGFNIFGIDAVIQARTNSFFSNKFDDHRLDLGDFFRGVDESAHVDDGLVVAECRVGRVDGVLNVLTLRVAA